MQVTSDRFHNIDIANGADDKPLAMTAGDYNTTIGNTNYVRGGEYVGFEHYADQAHHWNFITVRNAADVWVADPPPRDGDPQKHYCSWGPRKIYTIANPDGKYIKIFQIFHLGISG